uniref:Secreted protein n=1 Tax=Panagrellus redivivus TaxID=6233 RepID=A0A7E4URJ2_PANRE
MYRPMIMMTLFISDVGSLTVIVKITVRMSELSQESDMQTKCVWCNCVIEDLIPGIKTFSLMRPCFWVCNNCQNRQFEVPTAITSFVVLPFANSPL